MTDKPNLTPETLRDLRLKIAVQNWKMRVCIPANHDDDDLVLARHEEAWNADRAQIAADRARTEAAEAWRALAKDAEYLVRSSPNVPLAQLWAFRLAALVAGEEK